MTYNLLIQAQQKLNFRAMYTITLMLTLNRHS